MFKCTECGNEYEIKPEYCDCGNNEFSETIEENIIPEQINNAQEIKQAEIPQVKETTQNINTETNIDKNYNTYTKLKSVEKLSPYAIIIFILCLLLSFIVIFFIWNPKENIEVQSGNKIENNEELTIPNINSIWDNSLPQTSVIKKNTTTQKQKVITKKQPPQKQVQKPVYRSKASNPESAPKVNNTIKPTISKNNINKPAVKPLPPAPIKQKTVTIQDLINYKTELCNTIGRKIDFTRVVGDGSCEVTFRVSKQGNLVDRSFAKQSSNITLNDAVYVAIMSTPVFKTPPENYKNEKLTLSVQFYNGNFSINLK